MSFKRGKSCRRHKVNEAPEHQQICCGMGECFVSEEHYCLFGFRGLQCFQDNDSGSVTFVMLCSSDSQITDKTEHYIVSDLTQKTDLAIVVY